MQALLKAHQQLAVVGKRNNKWEPLFKTGEKWDFSEGSLRYKVIEAAHKEKDPIVIMDSAKDDRFVSANPEFRSALCFPVTLPGKKQVTIFVEEPEHPMAFSLAAVPAWKELAEQLEDLQPAPPPAKPTAPPPSAESSKPTPAQDNDEPAPPKEQVNWPAVVVVLLVLVGIGIYGIIAFLKARAESQLAGCTTNIASIVAASNMYARDHNGKYPKSVDELVGTYMLEAPVCPAAGSNTYGDLKYTATGVSVSCSGGHHRKLFHGSGDPEHWPSMEAAPPAPRKKRK
ncbi:hypothetical protein JST97_17280 [bacterium]|nr:hypothetical protein [bacterium]